MNDLWEGFCSVAKERLQSNLLSSFLIKEIVLDSQDLVQGLSRILTYQKTNSLIPQEALEKRFLDLYDKYPDLILKAIHDLDAVMSCDPAVKDKLTPFLYFKGFHALQTHRLAHVLWLAGEEDDALLLQSRSCILYGVDIHPAAKIGSGIMLDHATGLVIGETAVVEDHVSMFHGVTLGGTGKERGDRHPKVRKGVIIGAAAIILGNIEIGTGARIAAGSVVLHDVPPYSIVTGMPEKIKK
ncbi:serine O-acetyltransferase [Liberibacter crescens]|uniref:serine O-acetyltransferase n=1 Tax=Liberibacter crescens TaxID=1273132 RepID=UPI00155F28FE